MKHVAVLAFVLALALPAAPQGAPPPGGPTMVDSLKIDKAIQKGVEFLKSKVGGAKVPCTVGKYTMRLEDFILYTLVHADVPETDPGVVNLFADMAQAPLVTTYDAAIQAMILEDLNRVKYQLRIAQCAQFLLDNQCSNGQWSYGEPTPSVGQLAPLESPPTRSSDKPKKKLSVGPKRNGPGTGDNSNSQYAALGMRACADAGIGIPSGVIQSAQKWWRGSQHDDDKKDAYGGKGWCYGPKNGCPWGVTGEGKSDCRSYGGMTAGAMASLAIYDYMLGNKWQKDPSILAGFQWLDRHWTVTEHSGPPEHLGTDKDWMVYYYLYALERVGTLYGTEMVGKHEWYAEGANHLFATQNSNGSWISPKAAFSGDNAAWDTCFAILFLKRATKPLIDVATGGGGGKK